MIKFLKKNYDIVIIIIGFIVAQCLGIYQLVAHIPRGSIISIIGAYSFFIPLSIGLFLVSYRIKKLKFYNILVKLLSIALMVIIVIQLTRLIFGLS